MKIMMAKRQKTSDADEPDMKVSVKSEFPHSCSVCDKEWCQWHELGPMTLAILLMPENAKMFLRLSMDKQWFEKCLRTRLLRDYLSEGMLFALVKRVIHCLSDFNDKRKIDDECYDELICERLSAAYQKEESSETAALRKILTEMRGNETCIDMFASEEFEEFFEEIDPLIIWNGQLEALIAGGFNINFATPKNNSLITRIVNHSATLHRMIALGADVNMRFRCDPMDSTGETFSVQSMVTYSFGRPSWKSESFKIVFRFASAPSLLGCSQSIDEEIDHTYAKDYAEAGSKSYVFLNEELMESARAGSIEEYRKKKQKEQCKKTRSLLNKQIIKAHSILTQLRMSVFMRAMHPRLGAQCIDPLKEFASTCSHLTNYIATIIFADKVNSIAPDAFEILRAKKGAEQFAVP